MTDAAHDHVRECRQSRISDVVEFVAIPSVSGDPRRRNAIDAAAAWLRRRLDRAGLRVLPSPASPGAPIVRACWRGRAAGPTVLLYGHYDVQPAEAGSGWRSDPFLPVIRGERLYGRGSTDDKGGVLALVAAVESILAARGGLPVNVEFLLEGQEEIGSPSLLRWLVGQADLPRTDVAVIADTPARATLRPAVVYALRGSIAAQVTLRGLSHDVHAGAYGGGLPDAARELARLLCTLHDGDGEVAVRGLRERIAAPDRREFARMRSNGPTDGEIRGDTGALTLDPRSRATTAYERSTLGPSITVTSMTAGDQGGAPRNVIPATANARLDVRLAPNQDPVRCAAALERHLRSRVRSGLAARIDVRPKGRPLLIDPDNPLVWTAARALSAAYGAPCALLRSGGAVPVAETLHTALGIPTLLLGTSPPDSGMHAPNEFLHLPSFHASIHAVINLVDAIPAVLRGARRAA